MEEKIPVPDRFQKEEGVDDGVVRFLKMLVMDSTVSSSWVIVEARTGLKDWSIEVYFNSDYLDYVIIMLLEIAHVTIVLLEQIV